MNDYPCSTMLPLGQWQAQYLLAHLWGSYCRRGHRRCIQSFGMEGLEKKREVQSLCHALLQGPRPTRHCSCPWRCQALRSSVALSGRGAKPRSFLAFQAGGLQLAGCECLALSEGCWALGGEMRQACELQNLHQKPRVPVLAAYFCPLGSLLHSGVVMSSR